MARDKNLIDAVKHAAWESRQGIFRPRVEGDVRTNWPQCLTCRREVEAVEMRNQNNSSVELWARCHGKEDWFTVRYPYSIQGNEEETQNHLRACMTSAQFFNPSEL